MGYIRANFLGKEYSIPEDVLVYIDLVDFTENVKTQLFDVFVRKLKTEIKNGNAGLLGDEDLATDIEYQVGRFIAKLCDFGIFNRTVNDYISNNKGYEYFSKVNKAALEKIKSLLMRRLDSLQEGYEGAVQRAESHVTGMGFSIWSGSFVNHAIYAAMQASTINKQEKEASAAYQKEINELCTKLESDYDRETSQYINNEYIPNMEAALTVLAYELLDQYVADLIAHNKFDRTALDFVNISRSNDLLKNLALSGNKKAILENAFVACPYNIAVYMQAMKHELLDYDSFQAAKTFKQDYLILSFFRENWGEASFPTKFNIDYHCIKEWACLTQKSPEEILRGLTDQYATGIVKAYSRIAEMLADEYLCRKTIGGCSEAAILAGDEICKEKAREYVFTVAPIGVWEQLTERCGHADLLERVKKRFNFMSEIESRNELNTYLVEQLYMAFESARKTLADQIAEKMRLAKERAEEEARIKEEKKRLQEEKKAQCKATIKKISKCILVIVGGIIAVLVGLIIAGIIYLAATNKPIDNDFDNRTKYSIQNLNYYVPSNWVLDTEQSKDSLKYHVRYDNWGKYLCFMAVQYRGESPDVSVEDIVASHVSDQKDAITENTQIGGQDFSVITYIREEDNNRCNVYVTEKDSSVFMIYFRAVPESNNPAVFEKIVEAIDFENYISPTESKYRGCIELIATEKYAEAINLLTELGEYKDSEQQMVFAKYGYACELLQNDSYSESIQLFADLGAYGDCEEKLVEAQYEYANILMADKQYKEARSLFLKISEHKDSVDKIAELDAAIYNQEQLDIYSSAISLAKASDFQAAFDKLNTLQEPVQDSEELKELYETILSFVGIWTFIELENSNGYASAERRFHYALIAKYKGEKIYFYFGLVAEYLGDGTVKANISEDMAYELQENKLVYVGERDILQKPQFWLENNTLVQYEPAATATNGYHAEAEMQKYVRVKQ